MTDPTRLHEDETNLLGALLLKAGRDYAPSRTRLERIAAGIAGAGAVIGGQSLAAASSAGAGVALGTKASGTALAIALKWLAIGALGGLTSSAAAIHLEPHWTATREPTFEIENRANPVSIETEPVSEPVVRLQARIDSKPSGEPGVAGPALPAERGGAGRAIAQREAITKTDSTVRSENSSVGPESERPEVGGAIAAESQAGAKLEPAPEAQALGAVLREEVAALGLAKAALDRGAAEEALALVSSYRVRFPRAHLAPEATYVEMEAELLRGNVSRARGLAGQLSSVPSPNAKRVREVLRGGAK
jgi:hypothetical protein